MYHDRPIVSLAMAQTGNVQFSGKSSALACRTVISNMTGEARFSDCVDIHIFSVAVDLNTTDIQLLIEVLLQYSMRT